MAATIEVERVKNGEFQVRVTEGKGSTSHRVTVREDDYRRLSNGKVTPEELLKRSFEFLLEQESKESILPQFDLMAISRYFPSYEREIQRRLGSRP